MTVLTKFGDHDARTAAFLGGKFLDICFDAFPIAFASHDASVNARDGLIVGAVTAKDLFQRVRDFTDRGA